MSNSNSKITRKKRAVRPCKKCEFQYDATKAQCPNCHAWDVPIIADNENDETVLLSDVSDKPLTTISGTGPWDEVFSLNGGIVTVGVTLIGGAPGAGKSTMALQLSDRIASSTGKEILYVAAEEAKEQVKDRAMRLDVRCLDKLRIYPMGASTDLGNIFLRRKPCAVIVDSLPGLTNDPDQAVDFCKTFKEYAVALASPFLIIDHITKDHDLAGLMALQHEVDTILLFTKDDVEPEEGKEPIRQIQAMKNRFGPLRSCLLEMTQKGLIEYNGDED